ncbi:alpha-taxilin isoform X2 [Geospiza fortis]|uniref:Alpha-taxilin isoform X2 n=1 Tax=Geospiza fortis TaxID=48883 RepID=A0A8N5I2A9_GEOFO|nr:alpha-taxilin isoform X2 [Geospiza fortis]
MKNQGVEAKAAPHPSRTSSGMGLEEGDSPEAAAPQEAPLTQEDPKSSRDVSEELSRQLEDILSTYCVDASQENPGEDVGHGDTPEEPDKGRSDSPRNGEQEPGGPEINGEKENSKGSEEFRPGEEAGDRDQKKAQEKKKAKGLGKEITLLMQTLNTLSTSEEKLAALCKKYAELLEEHRTSQKQAQEMLKEAEERHQREKDFLLKEAVESQRMCELMKQQETHLKQQLALYTEKFEEFQNTLSKSSEVFTTFKQEMEKMTKKIKKLEKETTMYRSRWESSNKALLEMAEEKTLRDKELEGLQVKIQRLEKLCRALQTERNDLNKKVQDLCAHTELLEPLKEPPRDSSEAAPDSLSPGKAPQSPDPTGTLAGTSTGTRDTPPPSQGLHSGVTAELGGFQNIPSTGFSLFPLPGRRELLVWPLLAARV